MIEAYDETTPPSHLAHLECQTKYAPLGTLIVSLKIRPPPLEKTGSGQSSACFGLLGDEARPGRIRKGAAWLALRRSQFP